MDDLRVALLERLVDELSGQVRPQTLVRHANLPRTAFPSGVAVGCPTQRAFQVCFLQYQKERVVVKLKFKGLHGDSYRVSL